MLSADNICFLSFILISWVDNVAYQDSWRVYVYVRVHMYVCVFNYLLFEIQLS